MTVDNEINGSLLKLKRESLGWTLADMAARACLSTKQVRQLEEGGDNSFYSHAIKLTVAKKIAQILQISEDELFFRMPNVAAEQDAESADHPLEIDLEHQAPTQGHSLSERLSQSSEPDTHLSTTANRVSAAETVSTVSNAAPIATASSPASPSKKDADQPVSFASILTRSQSSSDDLDALLAEEESTPNADASLTKADQEPQEQLPTPTAAAHVPASTIETSHNETVGLPSTPSPITLSSASSSLSEDQHPQEQSIWIKVILAVLVFIGALLIVAPKTFDDLAEKIEGGFKKVETPQESSTNSTNTAPMTVPALDASQSDTPVEPSKPVSTSPEAVKPTPAVPSAAPPLPQSSTSSPASPATPVAPSQSGLTSIPTTAVPSANAGLGNSQSSANQKPQNSPSVSNPAPSTSGANGQ